MKAHASLSAAPTPMWQDDICGRTRGQLGARYWKPVQAGLPADSDKVAELAGVEIVPEAYRLRLAASPHQAAAEEGITIGTRPSRHQMGRW